MGPLLRSYRNHATHWYNQLSLGINHEKIEKDDFPAPNLQLLPIPLPVLVITAIVPFQDHRNEATS